ncbi:histone-lysine N-methyltransferase SETMAR-like [Hydra vulgaris]|uniref:Histone-lysine N-methyltransferase SETMAR-like n=1 Tax=Hydra vulgaris TaxID=6087 RepID=A0ABM4CA62_HYDVU
MECQVDKNEHFRHHLLFALNRGVKATEAAREICAVYGKIAIAERTVRYWFAKFRSGNIDLKDASRSGRPSEFDEKRLNQLLNENARQTTRELAERIGSNKSTVAEHLNSMGKIQKLGAWVPYVASLLACHL